MNVGTIEVLGALSALKVGIIGEFVGSCGIYTEGGGILEVFCVYDGDIGKILFSDVYVGDIREFVVLCGVKVGTTCVSVAFSGVKVEING